MWCPTALGNSEMEMMDWMHYPVCVCVCVCCLGADKIKARFHNRSFLKAHLRIYDTIKIFFFFPRTNYATTTLSGVAAVQFCDIMKMASYIVARDLL